MKAMSYDLIFSLIGPFFGVLAGFAVNYAYQSRRNNKIKSKYLSLFRSEVKESITVMQEHKLKLLPNNAWRLAISSGDLSLFSFEQVNDLSRVYHAVDNYIYEAKRARDMGERYRAEASPTAKEQIHSAWGHVSKLASEYEEQALHLLQELSNREWFRDC